MRIKKLLYLLFQIYHIIMVYENSKSKLDLSLIFLDFFFLNQLKQYSCGAYFKLHFNHFLKKLL